MLKYILSLCFLLPTLSAFCASNEDSLFKVVRIKTKTEYYIIHAKRNDSLFKIISKKVPTDKYQRQVQLKKGQRYHFSFDRKNDDTSDIQGPLLSGSASYLHVKKSRFFIDGKIRIKFKKRFHYRVYITDSLNGLYYSR